jgi:hypothetical protein
MMEKSGYRFGSGSVQTGMYPDTGGPTTRVSKQTIVVDQHPFSSCPGSGSHPYSECWIWIQMHWNWPKFTNKPNFLSFNKGICTFKGMLIDHLHILVYFSFKNSTVCDFKAWQRSKSALVCLPGSRYTMKPMQIHNSETNTDYYFKPTFCYILKKKLHVHTNY